MAELKNPLREWRGGLTQGEAARLLGCHLETYIVLEASPSSGCITTDVILRIHTVTQIPLPVLVDWLAETTKESVS